MINFIKFYIYEVSNRNNIPTDFFKTHGLSPIKGLGKNIFSSQSPTAPTDSLLYRIGIKEGAPPSVSNNDLFDEASIYDYALDLENVIAHSTELTDEEVQKVLKYVDEFLDRGFEIGIFKSNTQELVKAIFEEKEIEEVNLAEKIQNINFRFLSLVDTDNSYYTTEVLASTIIKSREQAANDGAKLIVKKAAHESSKKRNEAADKYAMNMFSVVENIKAETGVSTIRGIVELLDKREIATPNGGQWRINTIQTLQKRWQELGLVPAPKHR
ncbi:hypothetical protein M0L20_07800 [Spirosoma sp. RP8]|uniref:Recombinase domain-containing protein n=1 Tax=Spirosoma liriopis TaxID=2937440 RepID=A0ABT0HIP2_9BACT|nr:hypothetical protein [Spirosoma liriopis]MCK8491752.1 hypothetical protein [Spirosoma liriopis]